MTDGVELDFRAAQRAFSQHVRDPARYPAPNGLDARRVAVYRDAVIYNIERFMSDNFPRVKAVIEPTRWTDLVRDYLVRHRADTPAFARLPNEFLAYLTQQRHDARDPPYLVELAHFDWLENELATDLRHIDTTRIDPQGDLLDAPIAVNPIHVVTTYRFPVHAIDGDYAASDAPARATHIVAFRDTAHRYAFLDLNAVALELFMAVRDNPARTARAMLIDIATELGHATPAAVIQGGSDILQRMRQRELLLGTKISPAP
ncbi:MAG: putative DNA-binding domain-containing protein [Gammaproteobacteria bacterium]|nr:putative DNA-binding domain-containing protein [Gammaproteobacteria bacterium]